MYLEKAPSTSRLPNPNGPLSDRMPSEAISAANHEVSSLALQESTVQGSSTLFKRNFLNRLLTGLRI